MSRAAQHFVPVLTSEAGSCLTSANWQEVQVSTACFYLDSLLLKPGFNLLKQTGNLASYVVWSGTTVLNASNLRANKEGVFQLVSPYDGSKLKFSYSELFELINHLKPDLLIVPENTLLDAPQCLSELDEAITPFIRAVELSGRGLDRSHGVYLNPHFLSIAQWQQWSHLPRYGSGPIDLALLEQNNVGQIEYIESDEPALKGLNGSVFSPEGVLDLTELKNATDFALIDSECTCPVCTQQFTRAYLHHLYLNTPLLAQRFLIQHNVSAWSI